MLTPLPPDCRLRRPLLSRLLPVLATIFLGGIFLGGSFLGDSFLGGSLPSRSAAAEEQEPPAIQAAIQADSLAAIRQAHPSPSPESVWDTLHYLDNRANDADRLVAIGYLFEQVLETRQFDAAADLAEEILQDAAQPADLLSLARNVLMNHRAKAGKTEAALDLLASEIATRRRLSPVPVMAMATRLAASFQLQQNHGGAVAVYTRMKRSFFLNATVEEFCAARLARLERIGQIAPPLEIAALDGSTASFAAGQVTLLDFWATNCPPCLAELPELRRLHREFQPRFTIIGISLDEEEAALRGFLAGKPLPWRVALSSANADSTRNAYQVVTIPANLLIDSDGRIRYADLHGTALETAIRDLLPQSQP